MTTWYAFVKGTGGPNEQVKEPFGFYVHCFVVDDLEFSALQQIRATLAARNLILIDVRYSGKWQSVEWDDATKKAELDPLADSAAASPGDVLFSAFNSYPLAGKS